MQCLETDYTDPSITSWNYHAPEANKKAPYQIAQVKDLGDVDLTYCFMSKIMIENTTYDCPR